MQPKKLGIAQLPPSLFVLTHKNTYGTFHNSPSIPPTTLTEYRYSGGLLEVLDERQINA
ncbi:hypothetical protein [Scytonema sp. PCC 10023]|uniref:hypothetical protein n=1 Tax=Scytonema sp. PCC 10023 TaxID=1680591 RepID=UPI0039C74B2A